MSKNVMLAKWRGQAIVYSTPNPKYPDRMDDYKHNLKMFKGIIFKIRIMKKIKVNHKNSNQNMLFK